MLKGHLLRSLMSITSSRQHSTLLPLVRLSTTFGQTANESRSQPRQPHVRRLALYTTSFMVHSWPGFNRIDIQLKSDDTHNLIIPYSKAERRLNAVVLTQDDVLIDRLTYRNYVCYAALPVVVDSIYADTFFGGFCNIFLYTLHLTRNCVYGCILLCMCVTFT